MKLARAFLLIIVFLLSYWGGYYFYKSTLWFVWGETIGGDRGFIIFWSSIAYLVILVPLYWLICFLIDSKIKRIPIRMICYPILCALTFIIPTAFVAGSLFSPESQLFYAFFASSGIIFGIGYGIISFLFGYKNSENNEGIFARSD